MALVSSYLVTISQVWVSWLQCLYPCLHKEQMTLLSLCCHLVKPGLDFLAICLHSFLTNCSTSEQRFRRELLLACAL
jgi:hypothetical protein